ncbi:hypothetical protein NIES22_56850 [Calothrix brevissima NIES-22]|nr:hypothetical protein NIES22_56850 [Calothrix brevissima NIES-22]
MTATPGKRKRGRPKNNPATSSIDLFNYEKPDDLEVTDSLTNTEFVEDWERELDAGISIPPWIDGVLGGGYTKVRSTALTWNELEAMNWAISSEGKFAKNLINWNRGYLENAECIKDAQKLGLVLSQYNRKAKSGFCTIWVTPPEQRKFVP